MRAGFLWGGAPYGFWAAFFAARYLKDGVFRHLILNLKNVCRTNRTLKMWKTCLWFRRAFGFSVYNGVFAVRNRAGVFRFGGFSFGGGWFVRSFDSRFARL